MSERWVYDVETDGFLDVTTVGHCLVAINPDTGQRRVYCEPGVYAETHGTFAQGVKFITDNHRIGHNILAFDERVMKKLCPEQYKPAILTQTWDTLIGARVIWPEEHLTAMDHVRAARPGSVFPKNLIGRHSLQAWGYRLGFLKGDFKDTHDFSKFTREMLDYCIRDVELTVKLFKLLEQKKLSLRAWALEQGFAQQLDKQQKRGFAFDVKAGEKLTAVLQTRKAEVSDIISKTVEPFVDEYVTPKKQIKKTRTTPFNPNSRVHLARHFTERLGWTPHVFTPDGRPKMDEDIIEHLKFPGAELFTENFMLGKRLGALAEGKQAWLKLVKEDGRIHGSIRHNAAVTGRCTHARPNVTQVPGLKKLGDIVPYGRECRALWIPRPGWKLVGADAAGLELRMLAHYLSAYDEGAYIDVVTKGDVHSVNQKAGGIDTRERAKRFIYAWLYGAGDAKIALVLECAKPQARKIRLQFLKNLPSIARLKADITACVKRTGTLKGLDGRRLHVRTAYAALNTLLQGAGAVVMKQATVLVPLLMKKRGLEEDKDFGQVVMAHDEWQFECRPEIADVLGKTAVEAIEQAGKMLKVKCPLTGEYKVGNNWAETHG